VTDLWICWELIGSSAADKQRMNTIKLWDSFLAGTGRGVWCPRLQKKTKQKKHYDRIWHFLLSPSYLHVWLWGALLVSSKHKQSLNIFTVLYFEALFPVSFDLRWLQGLDHYITLKKKSLLDLHDLIVYIGPTWTN